MDVDTDYTCILICWSLLKLYLELIKEQLLLFLKFSFTEKKNSLLKEVQARVSMRVYKLIKLMLCSSSTPSSLAPIPH